MEVPNSIDRWEENEWEHMYVCPICGKAVDWGSNYRFCPNCGNRMYPPKDGA